MMSAELPCLGQPLPSISDFNEGITICNSANSSSSEEEYHVDLNGHQRSMPFTSIKPNVETAKATETAPLSGCKRSRNQNSAVSSTDFLRAAKMAQAAGTKKTQSSRLSRCPAKPASKRTANDRMPYTANPVQAFDLKTENQVSEPIYTATPASPDPSSLKLEKALRTVDIMAVVGRLCRVDGIMPDLALHVVYEYLRFIILLIRCQDWNATLLWPSPMVDLAWRQHVLDTVRYLSDCQSICGRFIHYNPDAELDGPQLCNSKYSRTLTLYKSVFGDPPSAIWPAEHDLLSCQSILQHNGEMPSCIQLVCRIPTGSMTTIELNLDDNAEQIFEKLQHWENVSPESHMLLLNGDVLDMKMPMSNLNLKPGMVIDVIPAINSR